MPTFHEEQAPGYSGLANRRSNETMDSSSIGELSSPEPAAPELAVWVWDEETQTSVPASHAAYLRSQMAQSPSPALPEESPPQYARARIPTLPVRYTFCQLSFNTMLLIPPAESQDTRPQYHISVNMNCFVPTSFITTIHRGAIAYGRAVAEFEMGISVEKGRVRFGRYENDISAILDKADKNINHTKWTWRPPKVRHRLTWDCRSVPFTCHSIGPSPVLLATFTPRKLNRAIKRPSDPPVLEVSPEGQLHFDHLLLALLIVERKRLTPGKSMFFDRMID
ncbi:hypothetical protein CVT24_011457 [Panaeolus cyanescens]|uniref:DUF6593 domain-containing protein n=1 Tax=Panaeolus cyanescens TaxID=181874 RepID=A0A409YGT3_9AGAR|nr:hypothetical protein CVT24_011457 [Panaeolus cyanescens]